MLISINAPAKINLFLDILKKRNDGYHEVEMIMQAINLFDVVTIETCNNKRVNLTCTYDVIENVEKNTAYIAAEKFFSYSKIENPGINIHIEKQIPIGAGLAGGSADAASVLVGLNCVFKNNFSKSELASIGKEIGADVPFCILGGTMLAEGIGTDLSALPSIPSCYIVLVKPTFSVSTKEAYQASDNFIEKEKKSIVSMISAIKSKDLTAIANNMYNRFEVVMAFDEVTQIKAILNENGALNSCMTGSGSAVYGIFDDKEKAEFCKNILSGTYDEVFLVQPINRGCF